MRIVQTSLLFLLLMVVAGCQPKGPEATLKDFLHAIEQGQTEKARGMVSAQVVNLLGEEKLTQAIREQGAQMMQCGGIDRIETSLQGTDTEQTGTYTVYFKGDCPSRTENVKLVVEDDAWKLSIRK